MEQNNRFKKAIWDKINSTFIQRIVFRASKREMLGYSAKIGMAERNDKDALLINWILRMYRDGYLDSQNTRIDAIDFIEYYDNRTKPEPTKIFTLYYTYPEWHNPAYLSNKRLVNFINQFYDAIEKNKTPEEIYRVLYITNRTRAVDPFDLSTPRFNNVRFLSAYCAQLMKDGQQKGAVEQFFHKYKEKYFTTK